MRGGYGFTESGGELTLSFAKTPPGAQVVVLQLWSSDNPSLMISVFLYLLRLFPFLCGGHRQLAVENLALRQQLIVYKRTTEHPTAAWTAQQIVEAFPDDTAPSYVLHDRDTIYGHAFRQRVTGVRIREVLTAARGPWQNPFAERFIGSIRR